MLTRLLREAERLPQVSVPTTAVLPSGASRSRSARGEQRRAATYQRLLSLVAHTAYAAAALAEVCCVTEPWAESWCTEVGACRDLLKRVVEQTERRVFDGETVPASGRWSLFEPHTDIICKGGRQTHYGHKMGHVVVESGNPAASERCLPM